MKHTHTRRRNCHKTLQRTQSPRPTFSNTNGPWRQTQPRTHWHERSGSTRRQEGKSAGAPTPVGLTGAWRCSACPAASFRSTKEKHRSAVGAEQGKNREDPRNKRFQQRLGPSPQTPPGACEPPAAAPHGLPCEPSVVAPLHPAAGIARAQPHVGARMASETSSPNREAGLTESKACFISKAGRLGGRADSCPGPTPSYQSVGESFYRVREQATCRNSTVSGQSSWNWSLVVWPVLS